MKNQMTYRGQIQFLRFTYILNTTRYGAHHEVEHFHSVHEYIIVRNNATVFLLMLLQILYSSLETATAGFDLYRIFARAIRIEIKDGLKRVVCFLNQCSSTCITIKRRIYSIHSIHKL